jgi:hypothetical protein
MDQVNVQVANGASELNRAPGEQAPVFEAVDLFSTALIQGACTERVHLVD